MNPADLGIIRKNEILGYCDIYKYILHRETVKSCQGKRKPQDSMEPILPQSLGGSDSEILGVRYIMMNSSEMNTGLRPAPPHGGRPSACIHLLGIHHDKLWLQGFLFSPTLKTILSGSNKTKDWGNIGSILSLSFRFCWQLPPLSLCPSHTVVQYKYRMLHSHNYNYKLSTPQMAYVQSNSNSHQTSWREGVTRFLAKW